MAQDIINAYNNYMKKIITCLFVLLILLVAGCTQTVEPGADTSEEESAVEVGESVGWTGYLNNEYEFSIKFPPDWTLVELEDNKSGIALKSPDFIPWQSGNVTESGEIYIDATPNQSNFDIETLFSTFADGSNFWFKEYAHENIKIGDFDAVKFPQFKEDCKTCRFRIEIYVPVEDRMISFSYSFTDDNKYEDLLLKIAETLTLTGK